jgi:hypothetical protein
MVPVSRKTTQLSKREMRTMSTLITATNEVTRFTATFSAWDMADDIGPRLNCGEVEALAGMLRALGEAAAADMWINAHATADDEGDAHHAHATPEYVVPVDPMDALECDSCQ